MTWGPHPGPTFGAYPSGFSDIPQMKHRREMITNAMTGLSAREATEKFP